MTTSPARPARRRGRELAYQREFEPHRHPRRQLATRAQLVARKLALEAQEEDGTNPYEALTNTRVDFDLALIDGFIAPVTAKRDALPA